MELQVNILKDPSELTKTQPFQIDNLLWGTKSIPGTSGYIGFIPGDGFYLKLICREKREDTILRRSEESILLPQLYRGK